MRLLASMILLGMIAPPASAGEVTLAPVGLALHYGAVTAQPLWVLAEGGQTGDEDDWDSYLELLPSEAGLLAVFTFELTPGVGVHAATVVTNYKGPTAAEQGWRWQVWDHDRVRWENVGSNAAAADWTWTPMSFAVPGYPGRIVGADGTLRVRVITGSDHDTCDLDELTLELVTNAPGGGGEPPEPWWTPDVGTTMHIQYEGQLALDHPVDAYDVDLFDTAQADLDALHAAGVAVICYFSAGSWESWRPDAGDFPDSVLGAPLDDWPGEVWLDVADLDALAPIMTARLDLAAERGCDAVDPDNVDGYTNVSGFPLTGADQLTYNSFIAAEAHARGLAVGLKNDLDQIPQLVDHFDFAVNEQCFEYDECDLLLPFVAAGKPVFGIEYSGSPTGFCPVANELGFSTQKKHLDLDDWSKACWDL